MVLIYNYNMINHSYCYVKSIEKTQTGNNGKILLSDTQMCFFDSHFIFYYIATTFYDIIGLSYPPKRCRIPKLWHCKLLACWCLAGKQLFLAHVHTHTNKKQNKRYIHRSFTESVSYYNKTTRQFQNLN